jgi:hypothetical protein
VQSEEFIRSMDSLKDINSFSNTVQLPHIEAFYIENEEKLHLVQILTDR